MSRNRHTRDLLASALLVVGALWAWKTIGINEELRANLQLAAPVAERSTIRDRLVGLTVPRRVLREAIGAPDDDRDVVDARLFWVVDLERCETCLTEGFAAWNALAEDHAITRHLVVLGGGEIPDKIYRALRGTTISRRSREEIEAVLGRLLPNTKALVDPNGTILMFDSRAAASECGWSFEAQVGSLRGVLSSGLIRQQT